MSSPLSSMGRVNVDFKISLRHIYLDMIKLVVRLQGQGYRISIGLYKGTLTISS